MTDEGQMGHPMDEVEVRATVKNIAKMAWAMFNDLKEEGFDNGQAMKLVGAWLHGTGGGRLEQ